MMIYLITMIVTCVMTIAADHMSVSSSLFTARRKTVTMASIIPMMLIAAVRYNVGTDYLNIYWRYYEAVANGYSRVWGTSVDIDKGLLLFNKCLQIISDNPVVFFCASSVIIYSSVIRHIDLNNDRVTLPVLLFFLSGVFFTSLNVVRQFMAFAIVLFFFESIKKRKPLMYVASCAVAAAFHLSAIVLIILYPLYSIEIKRGRFLRIILYTLVSVPVIKAVFSFIINHTRYRYYLTSNLFFVDYDASGLIYAVFITILLFVFYDKVVREEGKGSCIFIWTLLIYDVIIICSFFVPLANRMAVYFKFFVFADLFPRIISSADRRSTKRLLTIGTVVFMTMALIYLYYCRGLSGVFPYKTIWDR